MICINNKPTPTFLVHLPQGQVWPELITFTSAKFLKQFQVKMPSRIITLKKNKNKMRIEF